MPQRFRAPTLRAIALGFALTAALGSAPAATTRTSPTPPPSGPAPRPPGSAQDFVVNVGDRVFFESDSTDLTPTATATLDKQAAWLQRYPRYTFIIEGHADERGTREYNFSLGARRSQAVNDYLATRGVAAGRMRTVSYGKERPVAVCNDISCWSQNRRAVIVLDRGAGA